MMNIKDIRNLHDQMLKTKSKIGTLASNIIDENLYENKNGLQEVMKENAIIKKIFTRGKQPKNKINIQKYTTKCNKIPDNV